LIGFQVITVGLFTALGMVSKSIFMSLTRQLLFLIPFLIVLPHYWGTDGIWYSMPLSDTLSFVMAVVLVVRAIRKMQREELL
ncbi:MAG: MATE family efflux transporter, partial [Bacteroidales bacterium]|nr:MATE family efflux transporter [Bacteroidales bacterium]